VNQVLLTGATGTIGGALVPRLLKDPDTSLTLLVRAADDAGVTARLHEMLAFWQLHPCGEVAARINAVRGDITLPGFGLVAKTLARLANEMTQIIHCAASVKLNMTLVEARATAVAPTRTVLEIGRSAARAGVLRKIDLVSTVGVWGRTPGVMPERPLPEVVDFHNTYEAAKAEAERVVWAEGEGLPITMHRPSMVVGETATGRTIHFQVFYHLCEFLSGVRTFGVVPDLGLTRLDIVPVDWVADAICWASSQEHTAGSIFHLCSGPHGAIALPRLQERVRDTWRRHGRAVPRLRQIDRGLLERLVPMIGALAGGKTRRALRGLSPVLAYLAEDQGFSNAETAVTLTTAGLPLPPVDSYLASVLNFYLQQSFAPVA